MQIRIVVSHRTALEIVPPNSAAGRSLLRRVVAGLFKHPSVIAAEEKWKKNLDEQDWEIKRRLFEHDIEQERRHAHLRETRLFDERVHG